MIIGIKSYKTNLLYSLSSKYFNSRVIAPRSFKYLSDERSLVYKSECDEFFVFTDNVHSECDIFLRVQ